ncbi:sarcosine oxidase subunit delta [Oceanobacter mangrovi]|uniref:sarcosine oxidase subunit delta n=1 Tax=Oceanobacter mangrovi TaxID=2862510 RepID=UPI001C8E79F7|nr:sarcosine oxidase subunit delta [Oceanobacter mangrovi]
MLHIYCPHCCEYREEEEFHCKGQAHIARPKDADNCSDAEWAQYIFFRKNPKGQQQELWVHSAGCGKFFNLSRNTVSYKIEQSYLLGAEPQPVLNVKKEGTV